MEDTREVSAELRRLADAQPLDQFDTGSVLTRGRRGLRRRRLLGASGAVAGVAAAALAVTFIPNLTAAGNDPGVANTETENSQFSPVPGVPRGEDGAGQRISKEEAERRCALRYGGTKYPLQQYPSSSAGFRSVSAHGYDWKSPERPSRFGCLIPGGDKPSAALIAAATADPHPKDAAGLLRNCSVKAWVDMTKWHLQVADRLDQRAEGMIPAFKDSLLIATSPSGKTAISCQPRADNSRTEGTGYGWGVTAVRLDQPGPDDPRVPWPDGTWGKEIGAMVLGGSDCEAKVCARWLPVGWGQAPANTAKVVVQVGSGPKYDAPFKDGWFVFTALDKTAHAETARMTVRAYDKDGKLLSKLYPEK